MIVARPLAAALLLLGAFCPIGAHGMVHAVDDAHVRAHEEGVAHEHDAEGEEHEHELRHADEAPRVAVSGARLTRVARVLLATLAGAAPLHDGRPALASPASLDPPPRPPQLLASPSAAGRAPPA